MGVGVKFRSLFSLDCNFTLSEFHFLPHIYTFVTLIIPSSENSSRISLLKSLDPYFLMRVHQVRCEVTPCIQKHVDGHKEWNR